MILPHPQELIETLPLDQVLAIVSTPVEPIEPTESNVSSADAATVAPPAKEAA